MNFQRVKHRLGFRILAAAVLLFIIGNLSLAQDDILKELVGENQAKPSSQQEANTAGQTTPANPKNRPTTEKTEADSSETRDAKKTETQTNASESTKETTDENPSETQANQPSAFQQFLDSGALGLLLRGGIFMWPILFIGILAVAVIIERYRSLRMLNADDLEVRNQVQQLLFEDRIEEALELCDTQQGPVPAVLSAGLRKYYVLRKLGYDAARTEEQVVKAMDDYSVHIVAGLERHLPVLATVSSAAPMLGFLGTVQGMIVAFQQIVEQMGETNIVEAAANGIQVSLLTTCFGLIVGIPAFVAFNYFTSVINQFVLQVEQSATELIENVSIQLAAAGMNPGNE
ncbi:MAG: MotA/TolQ/ExbB proton channel family protein [Planctomycetota bacterium]|nr:MotA/TolQ/ExbB proton channel family protein [Planctomycetota bacterium]